MIRSLRIRDALLPAALGGLIGTFAMTGLASSAYADPVVDGEGFSQASNSTTTGISTTEPGELIVAFVAGGGPSGGGQTSRVSGAGLNWSLARREQGQAGDAEVWQARASGVLDGAVTASLKHSGFSETLAVVAFRNASGVGAVAGFNSKRGAPRGTLKTTQPGSWVWAVGNDPLASVAREVGPNQTLVHEAFDSARNTYWVQSTTSTTPEAGTNVEINDVAPTQDPYNLTLVEVLSQPPVEE